MTIKFEILHLLAEMVEPKPRYPKPSNVAPTSASAVATATRMETPEPLEPKAIYLDGKSFNELLLDCSRHDLCPEGTFQGVPLFIVRQHGVAPSKHIHIHGEPY